GRVIQFRGIFHFQGSWRCQYNCKDGEGTIYHSGGDLLGIDWSDYVEPVHVVARNSIFFITYTDWWIRGSSDCKCGRILCCKFRTGDKDCSVHPACTDGGNV